MLLAVVLGPSLDLTYEVPELTVGAIHRTRAPFACGGGKGLNMARAAHLLGADVRAVAVLGGRTGQRVQELAEADGVRCLRVPITGETRTCVSVAARGALTEFYETPTALAVDEVGALLVAVEAELAATPVTWVAVSGGAPSGVTSADFQRLVELAHRGGARVAVDCYGWALTALLEAGVDLVKINRSEAEELLGVGDLPATELAAGLAARAGCPAVVTDGEQGSACSPDGQSTVVVGPTRRRGHYPVGSGDSFLGGLLTGLDEGLDLGAAVRLGAGAATANALQPGQGLLDPALARTLAHDLGV